jgi:hypothetical protein
MPAPEDANGLRGRPLLNVLFWVGVGLAPVAALLLLLGQGSGPLRIGAVLATLAVVLIGLSITLRGDAETVRQNVEETLFEEIDELRGDLRNDIETAARATHKAFGEKLQVVYNNVEALRGQLEANRPGSARPEAPGEPARGEPVRGPSHTAERRGSDQGGYGQSYERAEATDPTGPRSAVTPAGVYGSAPSPVMPPPPQYGTTGGHRHSSTSSEPTRDRRAAAPGGGREASPRPHLASGVVRHTETVQVTTRQTIVGPQGHDSGAGNVYGGGNMYGGHGAGSDDPDTGGDRSPQPARRRRSAEPDEESWSDERSREQRGGDEGGGAGRGPQRYERDDSGEPGDDEYWSSLRAGDRWASVRSDERGREVRMGERRAAMNADESGTELRVEDRWAAVRREEPHRGEPPREEFRRDGSRRDEQRWEESRGEGGRRRSDRRVEGGRSDDGYGRADRRDSGESEPWRDRGRGSMPALPAGGVDAPTSWRQGRGDPEREPVRRPRRHSEDEEEHGYPPADERPRAGSGRRPDFHYSDERWR